VIGNNQQTDPFPEEARTLNEPLAVNEKEDLRPRLQIK